MTPDDVPENALADPDIDNISYRASNESPSGLVDPDLMTGSVELPPTLQTGEQVSVTVT